MDELIKQYYNKPEYSDVTVKWSGREIKAHRMVLCGRSEYFKKAIGPGSQFKESLDGVVELFDDDANAVGIMLRWMYTGSYGAAWPSETHLAVAIAADKYSVHELEKKAAGVVALEIRNLNLLYKPKETELLKIVEKSMEYPDLNGVISDSLVSALNPSFPRLYCSSVVQAWLDRNPKAARNLVPKHFHALLKTPDIVQKLRKDPSLSIRILHQLR